MGVHRVRQLYRGFHLEPHKGNTTMRGSWPDWQWPDPGPAPGWPDAPWGWPEDVALGWPEDVLDSALFIRCIATPCYRPVLQVGRRLAGCPLTFDA